jgi:hypothetical protein
LVGVEIPVNRGAMNRKPAAILMNAIRATNYEPLLPSLVYIYAVSWSLSEILNAAICSTVVASAESVLSFFDEFLRCGVILFHAVIG